MEIPYSKSMDLTNSFTISFWIFAVQADNDPNAANDTKRNTCAVIAKGSKGSGTGDDFTYLISLTGSTGQLSVRMDQFGVKFLSVGRVLVNRWTHLALVGDAMNNVVALYIHGVLDISTSLTNQNLVTEGPTTSTYVGGVPWSTPCVTPLFIDDLRIYVRAVSALEIAAESYPSLGPVEPNYARLGCAECVFADAENACLNMADYELCTKMELQAGGSYLARTLGWSQDGTQFWSTSDIGKQTANARKQALCCRSSR